MDISRFPLVTEQLLIALDNAFPEKTPDITETLDRIRERGGERKVVRYLRFVFEQQNPITSPDEGADVQS